MSSDGQFIVTRGERLKGHFSSTPRRPKLGHQSSYRRRNLYHVKEQIKLGGDYYNRQPSLN